MSGEKIVFLIVGGLTILVLVFIVIFSINEQKSLKNQTKILSYQSTDSKRPKAQISSKIFDLGKMKVKDEKSGQFTIENIGTKALQLFQVSSSCGCTVGIITINGVKSPEFGMHAKSNWVGTLAPGKKATLTAIYRPYIMPVSGAVTRDVYVQTNDPEKPNLTFTLKAFVE